MCTKAHRRTIRPAVDENSEEWVGDICSSLENNDLISSEFLSVWHFCMVLVDLTYLSVIYLLCEYILLQLNSVFASWNFKYLVN